MKKVILLGSLVVVAALPWIVVVQRLCAAVGDCTNLKEEENADCDYQGNCNNMTQGVCFSATFSCSGAACNPDPCQAQLPTDVRTVGTCYNGWWDDGCMHCDTYVCAAGAAYQSIDSLGACQNLRCTLIWTCRDCCVPDTGGD